MSKPLVVEYYEELGCGRNRARFARQVRARYTEGTLQRLLTLDAQSRLAAILGLRVIGSMASNSAVAACLTDGDPEIQEAAQATLWNIWFRADTRLNNRMLQRLTRLMEDQRFPEALAGLNELIGKSPRFAEAYNQRAILHFQRGDYKRSIADCQQALQLNPQHFGALSGMGQCFVRLRRPVEALKAFRRAYQLNPALHGVAENIQALEMLLEEKRREDEQR